MKDLNIRHGNIDDLQNCLALEESTFPPEEAASLENVKIRLTKFPQGFLVGEIDGEIVAQINSGSINSDDITDEEFKGLIGHEDNGKNLVIFSVAVNPKFQRQGIAMKMMAEFVKTAKNLEKEKILLLCKENLIPMYEKMGYVKKGISSSTHGGAIWYEMEQIINKK